MWIGNTRVEQDGLGRVCTPSKNLDPPPSFLPVCSNHFTAHKASCELQAHSSAPGVNHMGMFSSESPLFMPWFSAFRGVVQFPVGSLLVCLGWDHWYKMPHHFSFRNLTWGTKYSPKIHFVLTISIYFPSPLLLYSAPRLGYHVKVDCRLNIVWKTIGKCKEDWFR